MCLILGTRNTKSSVAVNAPDLHRSPGMVRVLDHGVMSSGIESLSVSFLDHFQQATQQPTVDEPDRPSTFLVSDRLRRHLACV